ncbi:MAG TPA: FkbM family methyltransferase [Pyrinomonadaceae bacterium]|nr:FkbM family methyltransferase [Pyrinomonadaceae bacterium]
MNLKNSWTVSLTRELLPHMNLRSVMRFRDYSLRESKGMLNQDGLLALQMKPPVGQSVFLREVGSDILTFNEVLLEQVYQSVLEYVPECRTIIDVGGNIGLASLYFAAHYPECRIFAIEPNPSSYRVLNKNLERLIKEGRAETLQAAVWGSEKALGADQSKAADHYSIFTTVELADDGGADGAIKGLPFKKIIERSGFDEVGLLKVDIEGAEVELFKGDVDWLKQVRAIAIEFHKGSRETIGFDRMMREYGFQIHDPNPHTTVAVRER